MGSYSNRMISATLKLSKGTAAAGVFLGAPNDREPRAVFWRKRLESE